MTTRTTNIKKTASIRLATLSALAVLTAASAGAQHTVSHEMHMIDGITNPVVTLTATDGYISTGEGNSVYFWGLAANGGTVQYPGPTLIVPQGTEMQITLNNQLDVPVSLVFPGQSGVQTSGGVPGAITQEALPGGSVGYTFTVNEAGTYTYYSGTRPDLQIEMGLIGALIVRPVVLGEVKPMMAYNHPDTVFDQEFLFLLTEMDDHIHTLVEQGRMDEVDTTTFWPVYWFINGRSGADTMLDAFVPWLPNQPYNCMPMFHPGERVLMRMIGGGRDPHPFHHHGNNSDIIARNGRMLTSNPVMGPDLTESVFTIPTFPGETTDAIFMWTGAKLGWDVYGHSPDDPLEPNEYAPDHGKPFPTTLPNTEQLTFGIHYSGSPFLGNAGLLPPGEGGFNPLNGYSYMWHSHNEKEICDNDIFPGGMMTMAMVIPFMHTNMVMNVQAP